MNEDTKRLLAACRLCPRNCGVNRLGGEHGFCKAGAEIKAARAALHYWEEPCLSGESGSGTVFFSHCTLRCVYCQNYEISCGGFGIPLTETELASIFLSLQEQGALNINLVTPTHYVPQIIEALSLARKQGLYLPVVYNSSGYESAETLRMLDGLVDIYLPDLKYFSDELAQTYSNAPGYFSIAVKAIQEMIRQVGLPKFEKDGRMRKGVIVRHLILPGCLADTKEVIHAVGEYFGRQVLFSLMSQYTPTQAVSGHPTLSQTISEAEYLAAQEWMKEYGVTEGFLQEGSAASESFIPSFSLEGLKPYRKES